MIKDFNWKLLFIVTFSLLISFISQAQASDTAVVQYVVDGDTVRVLLNGRSVAVRLLCIDAPEKESNKKAYKDAERFHEDISSRNHAGKTARDLLISILPKGTSVSLEYDKERYDQYGRTLAVIKNIKGELINQKMVEEGYAGVLCYKPNTRFYEQFERSLLDAKAHKRGAWGMSIELPNVVINSH